MKYKIEFGIDIINKRNMISRKNGEIYFESEMTLNNLELLNKEKQLDYIVYNEIQPKLKSKIFNIEVFNITKNESN